ncbi:putative spherulin [Parathielavia hyrcaniae]|uniref:Spherulin n=1 Tax=Parathielavia hyrcaniae TaxID=113614 RepID=A0AAN6T2E3_9PEZI|nr:putative spherulin [Parathielavia hyrcaniae]
MLSSFTNTAAILALASLVTAAPHLSLPAQLQLADTAIEKYPLLTKDKDFVFDFNNAPFPLANRKSFPALIGSDLAIAIAEIPACSMASLHIHPRSAEIFAVLSGRIYTEMIPESGVIVDPKTDPKPRVVRTELTAKQTTIFPMGSFHAQVNPDCTPALTIAAFSSDDPGAALVVPQTLIISDEFVTSSFGGGLSAEELARFRAAVPQGAIFEVEACKKRCGL